MSGKTHRHAVHLQYTKTETKGNDEPRFNSVVLYWVWDRVQVLVNRSRLYDILY